MTSHRRNSIYGLLGFAIPTLVTLAAYPVLVVYLGAEALGVYMLATTLAIGWSALDLGVAAATLKFVAEDVAAGNKTSAARVVTGSLLFYGALGVLATTALWFLSPWLVRLFQVGPALEEDALVAFRLAAFRFAAFFLTQVFASVFKAFYRFSYSSAILSLLSIATFGGAALGVWWGGYGLVGISWIALGANLLALLVAAVWGLRLCRRQGLDLLSAWPDIATYRRLFAFGLFVNLGYGAHALVSQVVRMLLAALAGPAAVAVFSIASTVTVRAQTAFSAMFEFTVPLAAGAGHRLDAADASRLRTAYRRSLIAGSALAAAGFGLLAGFAPLLARLWLPAAIEAEVAFILRILCLGAAFASAAQVTFHLINGLGRPAVNAAFLLINPAVTYAVIGLLAGGGSTTAEFAIAQTAGFLCYGLALIAFGEIRIWRRWIPRRVAAREEALASARRDDL